VPYKDETIAPGEEWIYELDGRVHGPMTRTALEDLLGSSGDTAADVQIREGTAGEWTPFDRVRRFRRLG
jgi:hypothetical protein